MCFCFSTVESSHYSSAARNQLMGLGLGLGRKGGEMSPVLCSWSVSGLR